MDVIGANSFQLNKDFLRSVIKKYHRTHFIDEITRTMEEFNHKKNTRLPKVDLYVLTSSKTFSAAEEFAYDLKHLKRATIIGEVTGGGAHPGGRITVSKKINVWTPTAKAINPITNTNWEGVGVSPDIPVDKENALKVAHKQALENLIKRNGDSDFYSKALKNIQQN